VAFKIDIPSLNMFLFKKINKIGRTVTVEHHITPDSLEYRSEKEHEEATLNKSILRVNKTKNK